MKKFKAESQKVLDMMINSIYTNKEIFLRELLSNCSDAIDKLYYKSLTGNISGLTRDDFEIKIEVDKENRTLKISDNGIGMTAEELENNLGVIAKSGTGEFKKSMDEQNKEELNVIGQFGVGFYSAFMVADKVEVLSKAYGSDKAYLWTSSGAEGFDITEAEKQSNGTEITLYLKKDDENGEKYSQFLEEYQLTDLIKKYSDYIAYPIKMEVSRYIPAEKDGEEGKTVKEEKTINSMKPLWKRAKSEISKEEYDNFYKDNFYDYQDPLKVIHINAEGLLEFKALLFIPQKAPFNYYTKSYEKGLKLYTNGVLISECNKDLLPDYFGFVKGLVDAQLDLNVSRETIQNNRELQQIRKNLEKKIKSELENMRDNARQDYEKFFESFGMQLKFGIYESYGQAKDVLADLLLYHGYISNKFITLKEYVDAMKDDQKYIYYATGKSVDAIKLLPQVEKVVDGGYEVLCMKDDVDEFMLKMIGKYSDKEFKNVCSGDLGLNETEEEQDTEVADYIKECLNGKVKKVRITNRLKNHAVCLSSEGMVSVEMEKVLQSMPNADNSVKAEKILEINADHEVYKKIKALYETDKEKLNDYAQVLLAMANLIEGISPENPTDFSDKVCKLLA